MECQAFCSWLLSDAVDDPKDLWSDMDVLSQETFSSADVLDLLGAPLPPPKRQCVRPAAVPWHHAPFPFHRYANEFPMSPWALPPHGQVQEPHVQHFSPPNWPQATDIYLPPLEWTGAPPPVPVTPVAPPMPWTVPLDVPAQESQVFQHSDWSQVADTYLAPLQELKSAPPPLPKTPEKKPYSVSQQMQSAVGPVTITFLAPTSSSSFPAPPPPPPSFGRRRKPKPKNAQCQVCSKRFESRYKLKVHMNAHTGERPFVCDVCGDAFMRSSTLAAHRRSHEEGKFSCPSCSRTFKRSPERLIHLILGVCTRKQRNLRKTTDGWHCDACGASVPLPQEHQCAPMGGRKCPVCWQDFSGIRDYKVLSHVRACHPDYLKTLL